MATDAKSALPTQQFINVKGVKNGVLILKDGGLRQILLVSGINFDLKSEDEQNAITFSYQNFLNSLNFSLQIFVHSRRVNIESYLENIKKIEAQETNPLLRLQIGEYGEFIRSFTSQNAIMNNPMAADIGSKVFMSRPNFDAPTPNVQANISPSVVQAAVSRPINIDIGAQLMPAINPGISNRGFDAPVNVGRFDAPISIPVKFDGPVSIGRFEGPANLPIAKFVDSPAISKIMDSPAVTRVIDSPSISKIFDSPVATKVFDSPGLTKIFDSATNVPKIDSPDFSSTSGITINSGSQGGNGSPTVSSLAPIISAPTVQVDNESGRGRGQGVGIQASATNTSNDSAPHIESSSNDTTGSANSDSASSKVENGSNASVAAVTFELDEGKLEKQKADSSSRVALFDSTTLFVPEKDISVDTRFGRVHIAKGAVVLVSSSEKELAVYDIHDPKRGSIFIEGSGKKFTLAPGRHLLVTDDKSDSFAMANAIEAIPHYDVNRVNNNGPAVYTSEFSIPAAIQVVDALKALVNSNNPEARKISDKFMKTAAILLHMRGSQYKHYLKPRVTLLSRN